MNQERARQDEMKLLRRLYPRLRRIFASKFSLRRRAVYAKAARPRSALNNLDFLDKYDRRARASERLFLPATTGLGKNRRSRNINPFRLILQFPIFS